MIDLSEFAEKKSAIYYWAGGKAANYNDFSVGEVIVVKASDGTRKRCIFSKKLIDFLEKCLSDDKVAWVSVTRP